MPGHTSACHLVFAGVAAAMPPSFVLNMGSIDGAVPAGAPSPAPLPNTTAALNSTTNLQMTLVTSRTFTSNLRSAETSTATTLNNTPHSTCLSTATIVITLSNPIPRPTNITEHDRDEDTLTASDNSASATPFDAATPEPISRRPQWFTAATFTLVIYDALTLGIFLWLWMFGYLWWFRRGDRHGGGRERVWQRRGVREERTVLRRMDRSGRYVLRDDWERLERENGRRTGRVRSESWERTRTAREAELENEMRRLGMI